MRGRPVDQVTTLASAILYRCPLPSDRLCRCGTVARALRADGIDADEVRVPWRRAAREDVDALTGQRHVPVLVIGRDVVCDSRRILEHLAWRRAGGGAPAAGGVPHSPR